MRCNAVLYKITSISTFSMIGLVRKRRRFFLGALVLIVCAFFGQKRFGVSKIPQSMEIKVVEAHTVRSANIYQTVRIIGTVRPKSSTVLVAQVSGIITSIVPVGVAIKKGELVVQFENAKLKHNYALALSNEALAHAQYERVLRLEKAGHSSRRALDEAKAALLREQGILAAAEIELSKSKCLAPFDGIVGISKLREGAQIELGDPIVNFYDPSRLIIEFNIPASMISHIKDGQKVEYDGTSYTLTHVQRMIDDKTHMCPAYVDIDCPNCIIGSFVDLHLVIHEKTSVLAIPYEATFLRNGRTYVYKIQESTTILTAVELGLKDRDRVEVISGLEEGDVIVAIEPQRLYPGLSVKIIDKRS